MKRLRGLIALNEVFWAMRLAALGDTFVAWGEAWEASAKHRWNRVRRELSKNIRGRP